MECGEIISIEHKYNKFCNHSCSAKFNNVRKVKKEKSPRSQRIHRTPTKIQILSALERSVGKVCNIEFIKCAECSCLFCKKQTSGKVCCGKKCGTMFGSKKGGKRSAEVQSEIRRSKNEIYFANLCSEKFEVLTNKSIFNGWDADVILPELKIAVLWNGPWHRKKLARKHSVEQVQNRDRLKIKEIIKCGFIPYIIEDDNKFKPIFVEKMFDLFSDFVEISCEVV